MSGLSNMPDAPHLAGQPRIYLIAQMKAFRSGSRQHAVMNVIAKPLTNEDIEVTADWFSAVTLEVRKP
jgi:cytochrome c553